MSEKPKSVAGFLSNLESIDRRLKQIESQGKVIIESGEIHIKQDKKLSSGINEEKYFEKDIEFEREFLEIPTVIPSIEIIDTDHSRNSRVLVSKSYVTRTGFKLTIGTWHNTKLWEIRVVWYAIGNQENMHE